MINKKKLLEFIPLSIFLAACIGLFFKLPFTAIMVALSGLIIGCVYFYAAYWIFANYSISAINRIIAGLVYSEVVITVLFGFLRWAGFKLLSTISFVGLLLVISISFFNYKNVGYKQLLYRSIFFFVLLASVFSYRSFMA